ncbi:hypothetical protein [Mucilaginibacter sp.]|uniref:hypothetical protein n=1 Tax=Mucilaginibacter sp. TaxID=1882438 RepID=UPI0025D4B4CE|nr:hypothetical protein [Mucilaginibacter sp.]
MKSQNIKYLAAFIIMLLFAFLQCYKAVHGLHWAFEPDFDRDIGYIRNTLNGHYGSDPNYIGEDMWYNPLLYLSEAAIVKITELPINVVVARAGAFLNLLGPIFFFIMARKLFDYKIALAALLSFLFLATGNMPGWGGATYSPLPLANCYVQFIFYFNIFLCYQAFSTQNIRWFIILGIFLGIGFLGHAAPTIIIILMLILLQGQKVIAAIKAKEYSSIKTYLLQGLFTLIPFLVFSFPFLYFVLIKYHLHFVNRIILQCAPGIFARANSIELLKLNLTFSFVIAAIGFVTFYKKYDNPLIRKIILYWLYTTAFMYVYEAILPAANRILHITLPDTIPALHYFFYLKGVQSVFFAFGFVYLVDLAMRWIEGYTAKRRFRKIPVVLSSNLFVIFVLLYTIIYYPIYSNRADFAVPRQQALAKEKETDKIEVYDFIVKNIPLDRVVLCKHDQSLFPVMATGIKMVSVEIYFSNPYVSYEQRENDRNEMLSYLAASAPSSAEKLFSKYKVSYVLLPNSAFEQYKTPAFLSSNIIFKNKSFTIMSLTMAGNK